MQTASYLAATGIVEASHQIYVMSTLVGGSLGLAVGIGLGLKQGLKVGIGSGIAAVFGGIVLSIVIANAAGFREMGTQELHDRGIVPQHSNYGQ